MTQRLGKGTNDIMLLMLGANQCKRHEKNGWIKIQKSARRTSCSTTGSETVKLKSLTLAKNAALVEGYMGIMRIMRGRLMLSGFVQIAMPRGIIK